MREVNEKDWKLFKSKVPGWQRAYMDRLNQSYIALLQGEKAPDEKFWELEKRIRQDKNNPGVLIDMRRSEMYLNLIALFNNDVITLNDLDGFSDDVIEIVKHFSE